MPCLFGQALSVNEMKMLVKVTSLRKVATQYEGDRSRGGERGEGEGVERGGGRDT